MPFLTAHACFTGDDSADNARLAAQELKTSLAGHEPVAVAYFASTNYDAGVLAREMRDAFPGAATFGCSSAGEFTDGRMLRQSVAAMAFTADVMERVDVAAMAGIDRDADATARLLAKLETKIGGKLGDLDFRRSIGFILVDGLADATDRIVERLGELSDVIFIGGCAADDIRRVQKTTVFADGEAFENGAVLALLRPRGPFMPLKTQSIEIGSETMLATRVDVKNRVIYEFDGRPAVQVYAEAMGLDIDPAARTADPDTAARLYSEAIIAASEAIPLIRHDLFFKWPLAIMINGEPFVRSAVGVVDGGGIQFLMPPVEGVRYSITRIRDVVDGTALALEKAREEMGSLSGILGVGCFLRESQLRSENRGREYEAVFRDVPTLLFSSYGEIFVGVVSQSSTMILFG